MIGHKKVLIFYITNRSGHHSAALALKRAFELKYPKAEVQCVNAFQYAFPLAERLIHMMYLFVIKRVPKIWERMYDNPKFVGKTEGIKKFIHDFGVERLKRIIEQFSPDAIVCTQAFPCGLVADYKRLYNVSTPLIGVLTDFSPHSFWIYPDVDYYVVPSQEGRDFLVEKGILEKKIKIIGIPIDPKFSVLLDRNEIFLNYGLNPEIPVVLIMGGGHGLGPLRQILSLLDSADIAMQFIVVCGLNLKLYRRVSRDVFKNKILSFRFTDQVERLMTVASLIITKPGGITTAEALAKKLPIVILSPIPGQEARNTQFLIQNKVALKAEGPSDIVSAVKRVLGERNKFIAPAHLSKPQSSLDIAHLIDSVC